MNISRWNPLKVWRNQEEWERQIRNLEETCKKGKIYFAMAHNHGSNEKDLLYNLGSFLLGQDGKHAYFYNSGVKGYRLENYIKDYEKFRTIYECNIGEPVEKRYFREGLWFRKYTNGIVVVNSSEEDKKIQFDRRYKTIQGESKTEFLISDHESLILILEENRE